MAPRHRIKYITPTHSIGAASCSETVVTATYSGEKVVEVPVPAREPTRGNAATRTTQHNRTPPQMSAYERTLTRHRHKNRNRGEAPLTGSAR
jgi:hypothetical protein